MDGAISGGGQTPTGQLPTGTTAPTQGGETVAGGGQAAAAQAASTATVEETLFQDAVGGDFEAVQTFGEPLTEHSDDMQKPLVAKPGSNAVPPDQAQQVIDALYDPEVLIELMKTSDTAPPWTPSKETLDRINKTVDFSQYPELTQAAKEQGISPAELYARTQHTQNQAFERQLSQLPEDQANRLRGAYYHPEATHLSPDDQKILDKMKSNAGEAARVLLNVGQGKDIPSDSSEFDTMLTTEYDNAFSQALNEAVANKTITPQEASALTGTHYEQQTPDKLPPHLQQLYKQLTEQTMDISQLQAKFGFDQGWNPNPDIVFYNNVANGDFGQTYVKTVNKYYGDVTDPSKQAMIDKLIANPNDPSVLNNPKLSKEDIAQLQALAATIGQARIQMLKYFENPDDPSISPDIKAIAKGMVEQVKNDIIGKYGLDPAWQPTISSISSITNPQIQQMQATIDNLKMQLNTATALVNSMPDGPEKQTYMAFLALISKTLDELQKTIYAYMGANSQQARNASLAKAATALLDLDQRLATAHEVEKKSGKMKGMGPLGTLCKAIMYTVMILACVMAPPPLMMLALAMVVTYIASAETGGDVFGKMFSAINSGCEAMGRAMGCEAFGTVMGGLVNYFVAAFISFGNPILFVSLFFQDSNAVANLVVACGGSETDAMITQQVFYMVAMICAGAAFANYAKGLEIGTALAGIFNLSETAVKTGEIIMMSVAIIIAALQVTASGIQLNNEILQAQITMIRARSEKLSAELESIIQTLKQLAQKLLEVLNGLGDWATSISTQQGKKWSDAGAISSELCG